MNYENFVPTEGSNPENIDKDIPSQEKVEIEDIENDRKIREEKEKELASLKDGLAEKIAEYIVQKEKEGWKRFYLESSRSDGEYSSSEIYLFDSGVDFSQWDGRTLKEDAWDDEESELSKFYNWLETLGNDKYLSFGENEIKDQYGDFKLKPLNKSESN